MTLSEPEVGLPIEVLLVEDDPGDVLMTREAFTEHRLRNQLNVVSDGDEALSYLRQEGAYRDAPRPDLILLDLNMPRKDGREALKEIKSDPRFRTIPVLAMTTSNAKEDIQYTYGLGVNSFIRKPVGFNRFVDVVRVIDKYWLDIVRLPNNGA